MFYSRPRWCSWLRHCATNRQVAGLIPDGATGIFYWHNPVGRTMARGSTQPLTETSTRNISWGVNAAGAYGWQPTTFKCRLSRNLGASTSWKPQGLDRTVMGLLYLFYMFYSSILPLIYVEIYVIHTFFGTIDGRSSQKFCRYSGFD
jgi:hypothetical protein